MMRDSVAKTSEYSTDDVYDEINEDEMYDEIDSEKIGYSSLDFTNTEQYLTNDYLTLTSAPEVPKTEANEDQITSEIDHVYLQILPDDS